MSFSISQSPLRTPATALMAGALRISPTGGSGDNAPFLYLMDIGTPVATASIIASS